MHNTWKVTSWSSVSYQILRCHPRTIVKWLINLLLRYVHNTRKLGANDRHFANDIFKCIFFNIWCSDLNITEICPLWVKWKEACTNLGNGRSLKQVTKPLHRLLFKMPDAIVSVAQWINIRSTVSSSAVTIALFVYVIWPREHLLNHHLSKWLLLLVLTIPFDGLYRHIEDMHMGNDDPIGSFLCKWPAFDWWIQNIQCVF